MSAFAFLAGESTRCHIWDWSWYAIKIACSKRRTKCEIHLLLKWLEWVIQWKLKWNEMKWNINSGFFPWKHKIYVWWFNIKASILLTREFPHISSLHMKQTNKYTKYSVELKASKTFQMSKANAHSRHKLREHNKSVRSHSGCPMNSRDFSVILNCGQLQLDSLPDLELENTHKIARIKERTHI